MYVGGYKIIDFGGAELSAVTPVTIPGVYDACEGVNGKFIVFQNVEVPNMSADGQKQTFPVTPTYVSGVGYVIDFINEVDPISAATLTILHIVINDDDEVTAETVTYNITTE